MKIEDAKKLEYRDVLHHLQFNNSDGTPVRWRVKVKHGLKSYDYVTEMEETEMTDFEFAKWLNAHGEWSFDSMSAITATRFFLQQSKELLAIVLYDNQKCERKIFIPLILLRRAEGKRVYYPTNVEG